MKPGLARYLRAAFHARPLGMFVAPNWVGLAAFALLGLLSPGFWLLGAGLELAYLLTLVQSARFRAAVDARALAEARGRDRGQAEAALAALSPASRQRFARLRQRCQAALDAQPAERAGLEVQEDELSRLLWIYRGLLSTRDALAVVLAQAARDGQDRPSLARRAADLQRKLAAAATEEHKKSLEAQIEIVGQRSARQAEAEARVAQADAELERIEQQVELLREETALTGSPRELSLRVDVASSSLQETVRWVREQEGEVGAVDDLTEEPPPLLSKRR